MTLGFPTQLASVRLFRALSLGVIGIAAFHLAYGFTACRFGMIIFLCCLTRLAVLSAPRRCFYAGLAVGLAIYAPQLGFFWSLFGPPAVTLWIVLAFWIGLFVLLSHLLQRRLGLVWAAVLIPFAWTGLEYFRSELYYLRFSWLNAGFAFSDVASSLLVGRVGVYGVGFILAALAAVMSLWPWRVVVLASAIVLPGLTFLTSQLAPEQIRPDCGRNHFTAAGVQMEFPVELEVPGLLDKALKECPTADLFMLSEYTFDGTIPERVREWCRKNRRYLVAGGKEMVGGSEFYDSAFVVGPTGEIVFQQAKSVPIQFFKDGLPAKTQRLWSSPWGRIGICICYDLSYSRVTDALVRQGARALLVPTMDVTEWGKHEHDLHSRVARLRASEYQIPILRVASSGVSQLVNQAGDVVGSVPFPEQGGIVFGELDLPSAGRLPLDRFLAPFATAVTAVLGFWFLANSVWTAAGGRIAATGHSIRVNLQRVCRHQQRFPAFPCFGKVRGKGGQPSAGKH